MKTFCVAFINFMDNELKQSLQKADTWEDAAVNSGVVTADIIDAAACDQDTLKELCFDMDCMISVIEVTQCLN